MKRKELFLLLTLTLCVALFPLAVAADTDAITPEEAKANFEAALRGGDGPEDGPMPVNFTGTDIGDGSEESPYMLSTLAHLEAFRDYINTGASAENEHFKLEKGIDLSARYGLDDGSGTVFGGSWEPIGDTTNHPFKGHFDGGGYSIKNMYIVRVTSSNENQPFGLFGFVGEGGAVENLTVSGLIYIYGTNNEGAAGVVGRNAGTVKNCFNDCNVINTYQNFGGVVGVNLPRGTVEGCTNHGHVTLVNSNYTDKNFNIGGVVGDNAGTVQNCFNDITNPVERLISEELEKALGDFDYRYKTGPVRGVHGGSYVGGVVGHNGSTGKVIGCTNQSVIKETIVYVPEYGGSYAWTLYSNVNGGDSVGGIVGWNEGGKVEDCNNKDAAANTGPTVSGSPTRFGLSGNTVGGVVGRNGGTVEGTCENSGAVRSSNYSSSGNVNGVGGVVGKNEGTGTVTGTYKNSGTVNAAYSGGGIVGHNEGTVTGTYENSGTVSASYGSGGILGQNIGTVEGTCKNSGAVTATSTSGGGNAGGIVGLNGKDESGYSGGATIAAECTNSGAVAAGSIDPGSRAFSGSNYAGGIVGQNRSALSGTFINTGDVIGGQYVGGIVGGNDVPSEVVAKMIGCTNSGAVSAQGSRSEGNAYAGGIVGYNKRRSSSENCEVSDCTNTGAVSGDKGGGVGGIVGYNNSIPVTNCVNTGSGTVKVNASISSYSELHVSAGGVVGYNDEATVEKCYNTCAVNVTVTFDNCKEIRELGLGGIVGVNGDEGGAAIKNCYNSGAVTLTCTGTLRWKLWLDKVGGVAGTCGNSNMYNSAILVENCYSTGKVTTSVNVTTEAGPLAAVDPGGVVGSHVKPYNGSAYVNNCYYLDTAAKTGVSEDYGTGAWTASKTNAEFKSGEVAWRLQNPNKIPEGKGYAAQSGLVWGQALKPAATDAAPVLTGDEAKRVVRVEFMAKQSDDSGFELLDTGYTNINQTVDKTKKQPYKPADTDPTYVVVWYTSETFEEPAWNFTENHVAGDMKLYAKWGEGTGEPDEPPDPPPPPEPPGPPPGGGGGGGSELWNPAPTATNEGWCLCRSSMQGCDCYCCCPKDYTCPMSGYHDLDPRAWYHDGIHFALVDGLMVGYGEGIFRPNTDISRAMIATILWRLEGEPYVDDSDLVFYDVEPGAWYLKGVLWARSAGVVEGYSPHMMGPDDPITREQLAAMLWRYARYKGHDMSIGADTDLGKYKDEPEISAWAEEALRWSVGVGIIEGMTNTTLSPGGNATRAEASTMLMRYCTLLGEGPVCTQGPCHLSVGKAS